MVLLESLNLPLGTPVSEFRLKGVDDKFYDLETLAEAKFLVIVFMCNHCPYVQAVWQRLINLQQDYRDKGVQFVGINSNINPDYPEDSFENMKKYYEEYKMNFPYLVDETQQVAKEYKAQCTPDIFVFDSRRKLVYHGRIDDNWKDTTKVTRHELAEALDAILKDEQPSAFQNPSMGCSIKWV